MTDRRAPLVELRNVSRSYGMGDVNIRALRDVHLAIAEGEFVAIVGHSGSGKSTLMNILGCLDRPTRGEYLFAGVDVGSGSKTRRSIVRNRFIGFVFQSASLLSNTSALANVELPLVYRGVSRRARRERALAALVSVGLMDRVNHTQMQLSGGQQQRVAIARAIVCEPPLLLADEPTGSLDSRTSLEILTLLQSLHRERRMTVIVVTHEDEVAACAERVITMRDGRVVSDTRTASPVDAASTLRALQERDAADHSSSPSCAEEARPASPVRIAKRIYGWMFLGGALGLTCGIAYDVFVLETPVSWIPWLATMIGEAALGASYVRAHGASHGSASEAARVALCYSLAREVADFAFIALMLRAAILLGVVDAESLRAVVQLGKNPTSIGAIVVLYFAATGGFRALVMALLSTSRKRLRAAPRIRRPRAT